MQHLRKVISGRVNVAVGEMVRQPLVLFTLQWLMSYLADCKLCENTFDDLSVSCEVMSVSFVDSLLLPCC
ncbi:hypothetical protein L6452_34612 [Arctium lappa]|uniref:Uncharacterized protein n=1 Tax=Arctium lappa TaxID=4217 RepID=A0ACB8YIQ7_ARCLA|nr:hypothetical protein L6452_34612 [Arctium lappa]